MWKEFLGIELPNPTICKTNEEEHLCMKMRGVKSPCSDMITPLLKEGMRKEPWMSLFLFGTNYKRR